MHVCAPTSRLIIVPPLIEDTLWPRLFTALVSNQLDMCDTYSAWHNWWFAKKRSQCQVVVISKDSLSANKLTGGVEDIYERL